MHSGLNSDLWSWFQMVAQYSHNCLCIPNKFTLPFSVMTVSELSCFLKSPILASLFTMNCEISSHFITKKDTIIFANSLRLPETTPQNCLHQYCTAWLLSTPQISLLLSKANPSTYVFISDSNILIRKNSLFYFLTLYLPLSLPLRSFTLPAMTYNTLLSKCFPWLHFPLSNHSISVINNKTIERVIYFSYVQFLDAKYLLLHPKGLFSNIPLK